MAQQAGPIASAGVGAGASAAPPLSSSGMTTTVQTTAGRAGNVGAAVRAWGTTIRRAVLLVLALAFASAVVGQLGTPSPTQPGLSVWDRLWPLLGVLATLAAVGRVPVRRVPGAAALVLGGALALRAGWLWAFDSYQISDFGLYYRCGAAVHRHMSVTEWIDSCWSYYILDSGLYFRRALLYTAPVFKIFGVGTAQLEFGNWLIHGAALFVFYAAVRRLLGGTQALLSVAIFAFYPEYFYAITLASPDNMAPLCVALLLGAAVGQAAALRAARPLPALAWAGILAAVLFVAGVARDLGEPLLLVVFVAVPYLALGPARPGVKGGPARGRALLMCLLATLMLYQASGRVLARQMASSGTARQGYQLGLLARFSANDLSTQGTFGDFYPWTRYVLPAIPAQIRSTVAVRKIATEYSANPGALFRHMHEKNKVLFVGNGSLWFASAAGLGVTRDDEPTRVGRVNATALPLQDRAAGTYVLCVLALALMGLMRPSLWARTPDSDGPGRRLFPLLLALLYLPLLAVGEVQARYSGLLLPLLAPLAASGLSMWMGRDGGRRAVRGTGAAAGPLVPMGQRVRGALRGLVGTLLAPLLLLLGAVAAYGVGAYVVSHSAWVQIALDGGQTLSPCALPPSRGKLTVQLGPACFGDTPEAPLWGRDLPSRAQATTLGLAVSTGQYPTLTGHPSQSDYVYRLRLGDTLLWRGSLGDAPVLYHALPLPPGASGRLSLSVEKPATPLPPQTLMFQYLDRF